MIKKGRTLARFIIPIFPEVNVFSGSNITPLGLVNVATSANKLNEINVEVIDENNYCGPMKNGLPDHEALQAENPAKIIGFYCGLTSTMDRVYGLSKFYHGQGSVCVAGGWHAHYLFEEVLKNNFDIVSHGDGEEVIQQIILAVINNTGFKNIPGISFWESGLVKSNLPNMIELPNLDDILYPDFGLIKYLKRKIKYYPINRVRGCRWQCEFCSVNGKPRFSSFIHLFKTVEWLVATRRARNFFIVDDRLDENPEGIIDFFKAIYRKYGNHLKFIVQIRLEAAENIELLKIMKMAGVRMVCVGFESPINEELKAMNKKLSSKSMIERTKVLRKYFWVHGMFIFGYPDKNNTSGLSVKEKIKRYKKFIRLALISSIQVLHPIPLPGSLLRRRMEAEDRLFPLNVVPWRKHDGNTTCIKPDSYMTFKEAQETPINLMRWFYSPLSFFWIPIRTLVFPIHFIFKGWNHWHHDWLRDIVRYGGYLIVSKWKKKRENRLFYRHLEKCAEEI